MAIRTPDIREFRMFNTSYLMVPPGQSIFADAKTQRHMQEHRKLHASAANIAFSLPGVVVLGDDPLVDHLAAGAGFSKTDLSILRLAVGGRLVTAVSVPTRLYRDPEVLATLMELKREARRLGTSCVVVPQRWLRAEVRSAIAGTIAKARHARFGYDDVETVLGHLREARISTIEEAAMALGASHADPYAVVLAMSAQGLIDLDRSAPLQPGTFASTRL